MGLCFWKWPKRAHKQANPPIRIEVTEWRPEDWVWVLLSAENNILARRTFGCRRACIEEAHRLAEMLNCSMRAQLAMGSIQWVKFEPRYR